MQDEGGNQGSAVGFDVRDALAIVKRRKWVFAVPAALIIALVVPVAFLLPREYQSKAIILIEQPDIPPELVSSTVTTLADTRIQIIEQRFKATANLIRIIDKYGLYPDDRDAVPTTEIVEKMRDKMEVTFISANVADSRGGRGRSATIAFSLSFDYRDPAVAQKVASELVSWYLNENTRERQQQAQQTASFLSSEGAGLERAVADLEVKLTQFREKYAGSLPEEEPANRATLNRMEAELRDLDLRLDALADRRRAVDMEIAYVTSYAPPTEGGRSESELLSPASRLKAALARQQKLKARYGENHPDLVVVRSEIAVLRDELAAAGQSVPLTEDLTSRLRAAQAELQGLKGRYADDHPEVVRTFNEITLIEEQLSADHGSSPARRDVAITDGLDNPRIMQLKQQLQGIESEGRLIAKRRKYLEGEIAAVRERMARAPLVEQEYRVLARSFHNAQSDYLAIRGKRLTAELGESLESEGRSERFSVVEPPTLPAEPERPKRPLIIGGGVAAGLGAGAGLMILAELLDPTIRSRKYLVAKTGAQPLAVIPYIRTRAEALRIWLRRIGVGTALAASIAGSLAYVHFKVKPLDVAIVTLERKLDAQVTRILR